MKGIIQTEFPNVCVMTAVQEVSYNSIKNSTKDGIRNIVLERSVSSRASIIRLMNEYQESIRNICIPGKLAFLKSLSDHYAETLRGRISSQ